MLPRWLCLHRDSRAAQRQRAALREQSNRQPQPPSASPPTALRTRSSGARRRMSRLMESARSSRTDTKQLLISLRLAPLLGTGGSSHAFLARAHVICAARFVRFPSTVNVIVCNCIHQSNQCSTHVHATPRDSIRYVRLAEKVTVAAAAPRATVFASWRRLTAASGASRQPPIPPHVTVQVAREHAMTAAVGVVRL